MIIIGAGLGGLGAAMILSYRGYEVSVFEREMTVGGRNRSFNIGSFVFNTGPTFLMMSFVLKQIFKLSGKKLENYLPLIPLDPIYRLSFRDRSILHTTASAKMQEQIDYAYPGNEFSYQKFIDAERIRFEKMYSCLTKSYSNFLSMVSNPFLNAIPYLSIGRSLYQELGKYFQNPDLIISFSFQSKYLGMSPWVCPGAFCILPYAEHAFGIDYTPGGLGRISDAMFKVASENGAGVYLNTPVRKICVKNGKAIGVFLNDDEFVPADYVIINADFGYAMENLFDQNVIRKWSVSNLRRKVYSCSTFMLYLGLDKIYNEPHHHIIFADDYRSNVEKIVLNKPIGNDFSLYINNASIIDSSLAPKGNSSLYVLVPVANQKSGIQWTKDAAAETYDRVLDKIEKRTSMTELRKHIKVKHVVTPLDWEKNYNLFIGATFNLGHSIPQLLYFRPHNQFEEVKSCYLVGGGTHPGSGIPTILESSRITADLICHNKR